MDPWKLAEKAVKELPPYLKPDELTAERLYQHNQQQLLSLDAAREVLKDLVDAGELRTELRRNPKGGSKIIVYLAVEKGPR